MSPTTPYVQSGEPLNGILRSFWQRQVDVAEQETPDYRHPPFPLARIKSDSDAKVCPSFSITRGLVLADLFFCTRFCFIESSVLYRTILASLRTSLSLFRL
jgi:hypothetical protein